METIKKDWMYSNPGTPNVTLNVYDQNGGHI